MISDGPQIEESNFILNWTELERFHQSSKSLFFNNYTALLQELDDIDFFH